MKKSFVVAATAIMLCAAMNLSATSANAGFFDDVVTGLSGIPTGSGR